MAYIERGEGHPILFIHGNPTSSFFWRNVLPHVERSGRRLIAPDLIGMGDSDKIPAGAEPDRYRFVSQARYLEAFIDEVVGTGPVTMVLHDWAGALGFDWAYRHKERVHAIAYMETFVIPPTLSDLPDSFHPTLKAVRSSEGESLVLTSALSATRIMRLCSAWEKRPSKNRLVGYDMIGRSQSQSISGRNVRRVDGTALWVWRCPRHFVPGYDRAVPPGQNHSSESFSPFGPYVNDAKHILRSGCAILREQPTARKVDPDEIRFQGLR
jgi:pimeloyl-ACP methyl ester carboxylesterase